MSRWLIGSAATALFLMTSGCEFRFGDSGRYLPPQPPVDESEPPARVARLSYLEGPVAFRPAGIGDWSRAALNRPLTTGDALWTDREARAELHLGSAAIRVGALARITLLQLDDRTLQAALPEGSIAIRLRRLDDGDTFEIDTPNCSITASRAGEYRIEAHPDSNDTEIIVRSGEAEVTGLAKAFEVRAGERTRVQGVKQTSPHISPAGSRDAFDRFAEARDLREEQSESAKYVSTDTIGYYDLDNGGSWRADPVRGPYWTPKDVSQDWAPYRVGRWAWIDPWGWTWIEEAVWGFAPSHYGRWMFLKTEGWAWFPGPRNIQPTYAPALVAFIRSANVAWFPLGPGEAYVPSYHFSSSYLRSINADDAGSEPAKRAYMNQNAGAITAVSAAAFTTGMMGHSAVVAISVRDAAAAKVIGSAAPIAPVRRSLAAAVHEPGPPASTDRQVISRRAPPAVPVPFDREQTLLRAHPGIPLDRETKNALR